MYNNFYDYSKTKYIHSEQKVIIICPKHNEFSQKAYQHLQGFNCPKCGREYTVTYDNNKTKNLRLRIKTVLETLNHNPDESVRMKKERERAFLVEMLKQEEAKIKANIKKENDDGRK